MTKPVPDHRFANAEAYVAGLIRAKRALKPFRRKLRKLARRQAKAGREIGTLPPIDTIYDRPPRRSQPTDWL